MGVANFPLAAAFPCRYVRFSKIKKGFAKACGEIVGYEHRISGAILGNTAFPRPGSFLGNRLKIEIYTDGCDRAPFGKASINLESWLVIVGILVINGKVVESHRSK